MIKKYAKKYQQFITYTICGTLATLVNLSTYFYLNRGLGISAIYSNSVAWLLSVLFAYITNKVFVFKKSHYEIIGILKEFTAFIFARLSSGLIDMFFLWLGVYVMGIYDVVVKIFTMVIVVIMNYIFSKFFVFRTTEIIEDMEEIETELIETIEMDIIDKVKNLDIIKGLYKNNKK